MNDLPHASENKRTTESPHGAAGASSENAASWRQGRPWLDAVPAAFVPFARLALARAEAALREHMDRAAPRGAITD